MSRSSEMIKSRRASETKSLKDLGREMVLIRIFFRDFNPHLISIQNAGCWKSGLKLILHPGDLIVGDIVGCVFCTHCACRSGAGDKAGYR